LIFFGVTQALDRGGEKGKIGGTNNDSKVSQIMGLIGVRRGRSTNYDNGLLEKEQNLSIYDK